MAESITFDTAEGKLIVAFDDGTSKEYTDRAGYEADFPDRAADCDAMGWE